MYAASWARRRAALIVLSVMVLATFGGVPQANAQIMLGNAEGTSYGWTFPEGEFPGAGLDDAADDVAFETDDQQVPLGAAPVQKTFDLVGFRVDEPDAETLRFQIDVAAMDPQLFLAENLLFGAGYQIDFQVGGRAYRIDGSMWTECTETVADVCDGFVDPGLTYRAVLYRANGDQRDPLGSVPTRVLEEAARIEVLIPRWTLDPNGPAVAPLIGHEISGVEVVAYANRFCFVACSAMEDRLPDDGPSDTLHALTIASNGAQVRFAGFGPAPVDDGYWRVPGIAPRMLRVDVSPDEKPRITVEIENLMDRKALLKPSISVEEGTAVVSVARSLEVPAGDARKLVVNFNDTGSLGEGEGLRLRVDITTLGLETPAYDTLLLDVHAVPALGPDNNRLYLHTYGEDFTGLSDHGVDTFMSAEGVLNTVADDPDDNGKGTVLQEWCFCLNRLWQGWSGQSTLPAPLHFDNDTPILYHLAIDAPVPGTLEIDTTLMAGDILVGHKRQDVALEEGENDVEVTALVDDGLRELEVGAGPFYLQLYAWFRPGDVPFAELAGLAEPTNPRLKVDGASWLELPLVDPGARYAEAEHLVVERARGVDKVQYVNTGRTALWNVTITNQAHEGDRIRITTEAPDGWSARTAPGSSFRLGAGESVTVGAFLTAPADAKEGDNARLDIRVASDLAEGTTTGIATTAVITNGVEIGEPFYVADNTTRERVADVDTAESPIPMSWLTALAIIAMGCLQFGRTPRPRHNGAGSPPPR